MPEGTCALVLLVGEQPAPNLLPAKHLRPDKAVLVHTEGTRQIAENLERLLTCNCLLCEVHPYDLTQVIERLRVFLGENLPHHALTFNLTGGTKPMALAAFLLASQRGAPFVYLQTEGNRNRLYYYRFSESGEVQLEKQEQLDEVITLDQYLRMYVGHYTTEPPRDEFEQQIHHILQGIPGLEVLTSVRPQGLAASEVDFVVRLGNRVGVIEAKTRAAKSGIDQIQSVAEQRHLGTYVVKFLISGRPVDGNNQNLAEAYKITLIELASYSQAGSISDEDRQKLIKNITDKLGGRPMPFPDSP